jgi:hypothetical protein
MLPAITFGQHRAGRGAGSRSTSTGVSDNESQETKDFKHAVAVQARPEQVAHFQQLTKSGKAVRKSAGDLLRVAETANQIDLFHYTGSVTRAVEETQFENDQFLLSFSDAQKSGLKELTKKLSRANTELTKENKALSKELERSKVSGKQIAEIAKKLDKALSDFQSKQVAVGTEMGIHGI